MKSLFYLWTIFQLLIGVWLFISPFILAGAQPSYMTNNMLFGALVFIIGVGSLMYEVYHRKQLTVGNFAYAWLTFQFCVGVWLFVSPFLLGYTGYLQFNDMLFGALVVALSVGTSLFELFHRESFELPLERKLST